jgi:hypothetical protein
MTVAEVARARALGIPLMLVGGRPYGLWRDWVLRSGRRRFEGPPLAWEPLAMLVVWLPP